MSATYADLLRLAAAAPSDEDARVVAALVHNDAAFRERSPLDATVPWLLWKRRVPPSLIEIIASDDDAHALGGGEAPDVRWPPEPQSWIETVRWSARTAHRALPGVNVIGAPADLAESLWRGVGLALVEAEAVIGSVVPASRLLRWIAVLRFADGERALFEEACARVGGLGALLPEARFHLLVTRRIAA